MLSFLLRLALLAAALVSPASAVAPTDSYTDADVAQSGYLPNHNMDPAVVDSAQFGLLWQVPFNSKEQFYAKPLVYTPLGSTVQLVFLASSQNWIRTLNAKTGALLNSRQVHPPFLQSDIGCTDIPNTIGIIGTPVIDPASDIAYFFSKTYIPNYRTAGNQGVFNGVYYFHGVNVNTLADVFTPILIDGLPADNAPQKYFVGGVELQRASLLQVGSVVYGAFGAHCDLFNYTGLVVGVDVNKQQVVTQFSTESGPLVAQTNVWSQNGGGGQGGIWMSGMGLASDGNRLFFVTGNGDAHENAGTPATGTSGCKTLGEAAVNLNIDEGGVLRLADYFQPYDYSNMDGGDQDFGSGGIILLDPTVFHGTGVNRMAVTGGKNGKVYILNADNLGGYKLGPGQGDNIVQTLATNQPLFGGYGSYPLEGGYIYSTPDGDATYAYKLGFSAGGTPVFSQAGQSNEISAGRVGVGIPTITSYKGNPGTGIIWNTDPNVGLRAWYAVPQNNVLKTINLPAIGGANKFQRPAFGDSRLYVTSSNGVLYCLGSPVNLPLNCTSPVQFGSVALGSTANTTVSCTANIAITSINGMTVGNPNFIVSNASLPTGRLAAGNTFTFPVTWDLTGGIQAADPNSTVTTVTPGIQSTALTIFTTNGVGGYSTQFPVTLTGTEVSQNAFVVTSPKTLDFAGVVLLPNQSIPTVTLPFTIANAGLAPMTIEGYAFTTDAILEDPTYYNVTYFSNGTADFGEGFSSNDLPPVGTVIGPGSVVDVDTIFYPYNGVQTYYTYLLLWTSGGMSEVTLAGTASTAPIANFSISTVEGGWLPDSNLIMDFGDVAPTSTSQLQVRICNNGGSVLDISKSKPPNGVFYLQNSADLHEEQQITIGSCAYGTVTFAPNAEAYNEVDQTFNNTWTLNTDDLNFRVHVVEITGTVVSTKVGPTNSSGNPVYTYLGCFMDSAGGQGPRLLPHLLYDGNNNSNANCQAMCLAGTPGGYIFEGTEYSEQCFCGNAPPSTQWQVADQGFCTFSCTGNPLDACGGNGGYISIYYDATRYTAGSGGPAGPVTVNSTGNYIYSGCYSEATTGRALSGLTPRAPATGFTIELCQAACQGYQYFGMEYANECYCGNTLNAGSVNQPSTDPNTNGCSMLCAGNQTEYCGGPGRLELYQINGSAPIPTQTGAPSAPTVTGGPVVEQVAGNYVYLGCYQDNVGGVRALSALKNPVSAALNTPDVCATACTGYQYMGVEYSGECYCDNVIGGNNTIAPGGADPNANGCSMTCKGNSSEYCGGPNRLNVYILNSNATGSSPTSTAASTVPTASPTGPIVVQTAGPYVYAGCYVDNTNGRALSALLNPESGVNSTVEACAAACSGYKYMGVEYGDECYCANIIGGGNGVAPGGSNVMANGCSMTCAGNPGEYCGGPNRLNLYTLGGNATVSTSAPTSTPTSTPNSTLISAPTSTPTSMPTPSSTPAGPVTVGNFDVWSYMGCYTEATGNRALSDLQNPIKGTAVTVEACGNACSAYTYFGVEYSGECYCGNTINNGSVLVTGATVAATKCSMTCSGNNTEYCGGPNRLNMYSQVLTAPTASSTASTAPTPTPSGPITVTQLAGYTYLGCYNEPSNARALTGFQYAIPGANVSVENCAVGCAGYTFFGVEYATQCFCGNTIAPGSAAQNGTTVAATKCNMVCAANATEYCGGPNRLNMYQVVPAASSTAASSSSSTYSSSAGSMTSGLSMGSITASLSSTATSATGSTTAGGSASTTIVTGSLTTTAATTGGTTTGTTSTESGTTSGTTSTGSGTTTGSTSTGSGTTTGTTSTGSGTTPGTTSTVSGTTAATTTSVSTTSTVSSTASVSTSVTSSMSTSTSSSASSSTTASTSISSSTSVVSTTAISTSTTSITSTTSSTSIPSSSSTSTGSVVTTTSLTSTTTATSSTTTTSSAATFIPTPGQVVNGAWVYLGCANETTPRALSAASYTNGTGMTVESCQAFCSSNKNNYGLAGLEYSGECYCGNALQQYSALGFTGCNMACSGNQSEICGGSSRLSVYNLTSYVPPTTVRAVGSYAYQGCYKEATSGRLLGGPRFTNTTGMTVEACVAFCQGSSPSQAYAGVEYAQECYCGSSLPSSPTMVADSSCNMLCTGNKKEFCGAASLLNVYRNVPNSVTGNGQVDSNNAPNAATIAANTNPPASSPPASSRPTSSAGSTVSTVSTPVAGSSTVAPAPPPVTSTVSP